MSKKLSMEERIGQITNNGDDIYTTVEKLYDTDQASYLELKELVKGKLGNVTNNQNICKLLLGRRVGVKSYEKIASADEIVQNETTNGYKFDSVMVKAWDSIKEEEVLREVKVDLVVENINKAEVVKTLTPEHVVMVKDNQYSLQSRINHGQIHKDALNQIKTAIREVENKALKVKNDKLIAEKELKVENLRVIAAQYFK